MVACPVLPISPKSLKVFQTHLMYLHLHTALCGAQADVGTTSVLPSRIPAHLWGPLAPDHLQPNSLCQQLEEWQTPDVLCTNTIPFVVSPVMQSGCHLSCIRTYNRCHHFTESGLRSHYWHNESRAKPAQSPPSQDGMPTSSPLGVLAASASWHHLVSAK